MEENKNLEKLSHHHNSHKNHDGHKHDNCNKEEACCFNGFVCRCGGRFYRLAKASVFVLICIALFSLGVNVGTRMISKYESRMGFCGCSHGNTQAQEFNCPNRQINNLLPTGVRDGMMR